MNCYDIIRREPMFWTRVGWGAVSDLGSDGYIDLISGKRAEEMTTLDPKGAYVFVKQKDKKK